MGWYTSAPPLTREESWGVTIMVPIPSKIGSIFYALYTTVPFLHHCMPHTTPPPQKLMNIITQVDNLCDTHISISLH